MKTAMELALVRIEMLYGMKPDDIHWEMFKNDCMEKEKEQIMKSFDYGDFCIDLPDGTWEQKYKSAEEYYNQTYNQNK